MPFLFVSYSLFIPQPQNPLEPGDELCCLRVVRLIFISALSRGLPELLAKPLVQLFTRIERRMRFGFASRGIAGHHADVGHMLKRPPKMSRIVSNRFQRQSRYHIAEKFDLSEQALVISLDRLFSFVPKIFVGEFVRNNAADLGLAGD